MHLNLPGWRTGLVIYVSVAHGSPGGGWESESRGPVEGEGSWGRRGGLRGWSGTVEGNLEGWSSGGSRDQDDFELLIERLSGNE